MIKSKWLWSEVSPKSLSIDHNMLLQAMPPYELILYEGNTKSLLKNKRVR